MIHFGPIDSKGGMSTVMSSLLNNDIPGWNSRSVSTHSESSLVRKITAWYFARKELKRLIKQKEIDLAHFHVTHSMSWWRKRDLMKICAKNGVPTIIHIHSGKFDEFCKGFKGKNVKNELSISGRKTIVLEERWLKKLEHVLPGDAEVVPNICEMAPHGRGVLTPKEPIKFLVLSRVDSAKGRDLAIKIVQEVRDRGIESELTITGAKEVEYKKPHKDWIKSPGWVSEEKRDEILYETDIMLSPSLYEGSSMSVIESMVCGIPCICSPVSEETVGIQELVVDSTDPTAWADRIEEILEKSKFEEIVKKIEGKSKKYHPESVIQRWSEVYSLFL